MFQSEPSRSSNMKSNEETIQKDSNSDSEDEEAVDMDEFEESGLLDEADPVCILTFNSIL